MEPIEDLNASEAISEATQGLEQADYAWREALSGRWLTIYKRLLQDVDGLFAQAGIQRKDVELTIYGTQTVTGADIALTEFDPSGDVPADYASDYAGDIEYLEDEDPRVCDASAAPCDDCDCGYETLTSAPAPTPYDSLLTAEPPVADTPIDPAKFFSKEYLKEVITCGYCGKDPLERGFEESTSTILNGETAEKVLRAYRARAVANSAVKAKADQEAFDEALNSITSLKPEEFFKPKAMATIVDAIKQHKDVEVGVSNDQIASTYKAQLLEQLHTAAKYNPALQLVDIDSIADAQAEQYVAHNKRAVVEIDDKFVHTEQLGTQEDITNVTKEYLEGLAEKSRREQLPTLFNVGDRVKIGSYFRGFVTEIIEPYNYGPGTGTATGANFPRYNVQVQDSEHVLPLVPEHDLALWPFEAPLK
jgi:hypothetical protein